MAATSRTGTTAQRLIQAAFKTTMASAMLAADSMVVVRICEPVRPSLVWPYSLAMTTSMTFTVIIIVMRAAMAAPQPRGLTGLLDPKARWYTRAATVVPSPAIAMLKASLRNAILRTA